MTSPVVYSVLRPPKVNKGRTMLRVARAENHRWRRGDRLAIVAKKRVNLLQIAQGVKCTHHEVIAVNPDDGSTDTLVLMGAVPPHDWRAMRLLDVDECERLAKTEDDQVYTRVAGADTLPTGHSEKAYIPGVRSSAVVRGRAHRPVSRRSAAVRYSDWKPAGYVPVWAFTTVSAALLIAATGLVVLLV